MTYHVPPNIDNDKIFIVNRSKIENRLDAQYYNANLDLHGFVKLSSVAIVKGGKRIPKGHSYSLESTPYCYLRVADMVSDTQVDVNSLKNISKDVFEMLKRYEITEGELAVSIAGTIGKTCILTKISNEKRVILTENSAKIIVKPNVELLSEYLKICFDLPIVKKQLNLNYIQTTIPKLGIDKILGIKIPPIPTLQKQNEIIELIDCALNQKQEAEAKAQQLLDSIDGYLLKELGIELSKAETDLNSRIFYIQKSDCIERFDPKYNKRFAYIKSLHGSYQWVTLKDVAINTGQYGANEPAIDFENGDVRYIRITDIDELGRLKEYDKKTAKFIDQSYLLQEEDILFARSGSVGRCYIHHNNIEPAIFAGYLIRYRLNTVQINPWYLFFYCHSAIYRYWIDTIQRPAVQANINAEEYRTLPIPLPPLSKQNIIVDYIKKIHQDAKALQEEGKIILEKAKREVERMIIGENDS